LRAISSGSALAIAVLAAALAPARVPKLAHPTAAPVAMDDGRPYGPEPYRLVIELGREAHVSAIRARFRSPMAGVPTRYAWEVRRCDEASFEPIAGASEDRDAESQALPTRRTWFVDAVGCALRLTVASTNSGVPAIDSIEPVEGARDVLRGAVAIDDSEAATPALTDGAYETAWAGAAGRGRWTVTLPLQRAAQIDRVRLVLGANATSIPRKTLGRDYAVARAPLRWTLLASEDGSSFSTIARSSATPVRRPLVRVTSGRAVVALRLVLEGATDELGVPSATASPIVRELAAYAADDPRPIVSEPWVLSVNANPAASAHAGQGGELANDVYYAKFLQLRFGNLSAAAARDDRFTRMLGPRGELLKVDASASDGRGLEAIEGDDPVLDEAWLTASWPPPIVVLSGSNDWDYARRTSTTASGRTRWNPLLGAREGGMGALASAVRGRAVPLIGICGGAQILALLEAREDGDGDEIDRVLRRNTGRPIRGFAPRSALIRAWPGEGAAGVPVSFDPHDPLFADLGARGRTTTHALPQSHLDLIRPDAFADGGPLARFRILASSLFCSPVVVASLSPNPNGKGRCARVTEAFRARDGAWPLIGVQFHPEQRDFAVAPNGDPPEAVADARLFMAAAYEETVDAYLRNATR